MRVRDVCSPRNGMCRAAHITWTRVYKYVGILVYVRVCACEYVRIYYAFTCAHIRCVRVCVRACRFEYIYVVDAFTRLPLMYAIRCMCEITT